MNEWSHRLYHIRVGVVLDSTWQEWFEGLALHPQTDGTTVLSGMLDDQTALHTILNKIRNLNLDLISVSFIETSSNREENLP
jgi:hypothetical protein